MEIIDDEANSHIVSWLPEGNGFTIHDKKKFEQIILPKIMNKKVHYSSFTRRMNRWNFVLYNISHSTSRYFHPLFIKGDYERAKEMSPQPQKQWRKTKDGDWETREPSSHEGKKISKASMDAIIESNLESYRQMNQTPPVFLRPPPVSLNLPSPVRHEFYSKSFLSRSDIPDSSVSNHPSLIRTNPYPPNQYPMPLSYSNLGYKVPQNGLMSRYYESREDPMKSNGMVFPEFLFRAAW
jgi:hypothetical protein